MNVRQLILLHEILQLLLYKHTMLLLLLLLSSNHSHSIINHLLLMFPLHHKLHLMLLNIILHMELLLNKPYLWHSS
ncbi:hypothetical protein TVAG_154140 [Trichomonas vaginalis G3]|uniref:Uncharacterized protein n=1 Tax=Trichomonas vaginalis (strain ATCC PRA-98 / G3) TaxID=412133 RepID=A2E420_TRIV3|nr:hypothetical protein TVAGG3_0703790 [Trichomonas vaginalis G3]EAY12563.1 hypothetical protein TVAG_154140 [Trichomonas vaginalis G3]KAI5509426.1 hypothetical protein TVAGG3_0703790 [Trichomonas vaginalis G3]|eukprot:XP_001324786.1 hypothetical protein [Trichomonas vaginalis G3]